MGHLYLYPDPSLIDHWHDRGILHKTGEAGKGSSKSPQSTMHRIGAETPAHRPGEEIPGTRYLTRNRKCHEHGQAVPADQ